MLEFQAIYTLDVVETRLYKLLRILFLSTMCKMHSFDDDADDDVTDDFQVELKGASFNW